MRRFWRWTLLSAAALLLFSMTPVLAGCGGDGGDAGGVPGAVLAMVEKVPGDAGECTFLDLGELRADGDLKDIYESTTLEISDSEDAVISPENVDRMVQAGRLTILEGRFDLASLEAQLAGGGYTESDHEGTPVWRGPSSSVAVVSASCLVTGWDAEELGDCIDVIGGDGESLYDSEDVRELLDRLPGGFMVMVFAGGEDFEDLYQGVRAVGYSLSKEGPDRARMTLILAFADAASAGEAEGDVEEMLTYEGGEQGASNISVTRDGRYVKATGDMPIEGALD
jgi:hypothetical protein